MREYSSLRPITATDDAAGFDSGTPTLDDYLRKRALANQLTDIARCYVTLHSGRVVGFYTLSTSAVLRAGLPTGLRKNSPNPVPALVIGRLAVDRAHHGQGLGSGLVRDAILRSVQVSEIAGAKLLIVHTLNESAAAFWRHHEFEPMPDNKSHLMLSMKNARAALDENI